MKLLFDQNLSHRLCALLADTLPGAEQVKRVGLDQAEDAAIWDYALRGDYAIVTLDSDFADMAALRGAPPKVIWLRCGNQPTAAVEALIRGHADLIASFLASDELACLELY